MAAPVPGWASAAGLLRLRPLGAEADGEAADRLLVVDRVHRYGWAFDERDPEALAACFTEDAVWEGSILGAKPVPPIHGREAIVAWLSGFWERQDDQRRHLMLDVTVDVRPDGGAEALAALALIAARADALAFELTSFYAFRLEREAGAWRIARLFEGFDTSF